MLEEIDTTVKERDSHAKEQSLRIRKRLGADDFHLHTKADKEFRYDGDDNSFVGAYIDKLEKAGVRLGAITNHNKFDMGEFKALRKAARKRGIGLLPGVELSVNEVPTGSIRSSYSLMTGLKMERITSISF